MSNRTFFRDLLQLFPEDDRHRTVYIEALWKFEEYLGSAIREFDFNTQDFLRFTYSVREKCPARYFRLHRAALKKLWVTGYEAGLIRDKPFFLEDCFPFE